MACMNPPPVAVHGASRGEESCRGDVQNGRDCRGDRQVPARRRRRCSAAARNYRHRETAEDWGAIGIQMSSMRPCEVGQLPTKLPYSPSLAYFCRKFMGYMTKVFLLLSPFLRKRLLLHPESDDSAQLSQIETEKLLAQLVETEINKRLDEGTYKGKKFNAICHFFGYQARGALPSKFDCDYAYILGHVSYHILAAGLSGYMATVTNLKSHVEKWECGAAPITSMMTVKRWSRGPAASQIGKPAVHMANVDLKGKAYELLRQNSSSFLMDDIYKNPGPLQFEGAGAEAKPISLCVEDRDYMGRIKQLQEYLEKVKSMVKPGCSQDVLKAAISSMAHVTELLTIMSSPSYNGQATI